MELIDCHCHLEDTRFKEDQEAVVTRAQEAGVRCIINSGVNPTSNRAALALTKKYPGVVKASFGIYPVDAVASQISGLSDDFVRDLEAFDVDEELAWIEANAESCVAIGEVGLDYKLVEGHDELQKENFRKAISLALKLDKPLVIHSRKGEADALDLLEEMGAKKVMMHCFHGRKSLIRKAVGLGFYISVPPVITRLDHFKMLVELVPLEQLVTETDAPYLSPIAGERNESANIPVTIKEIAKIKGLSEGEVAEKLYENAVRLFGLK